jgi:hypothetical protein
LQESGLFFARPNTPAGFDVPNVPGFGTDFRKSKERQASALIALRIDVKCVAAISLRACDANASTRSHAAGMIRIDG